MRPGLVLLLATAMLLAPLVWAALSLGAHGFRPHGTAAYQSSSECEMGMTWHWGECR
jgi:hypothetical protein